MMTADLMTAKARCEAIRWPEQHRDDCAWCAAGPEEREAVERYQAALAAGLSDHEAREEGWPDPSPDETRWRHLSLMGDVHPPQPDLTREYIQPGTGRREAPCLCPDCQGRQAVVFR